VYRKVDADRVERTFVQLAGESAKHVVIASGLSAGDVVVTDPSRLDGVKVR